MGMLLLTTALMMEARPLVGFLGLRSVEGPFPVYENDKVCLVVTGTGTHRAAAATGWAIGRLPMIKAALNIGFCGALPTVAALHEWVLIHSLRDATTERLSIPDILYRHGFQEAALLTVPKIVTQSMDWNGVVDMEGTAFFEAARQHLPVHQICLLKWVSDALTGRIDIADTEKAFNQGLSSIQTFLHAWIERGQEKKYAPEEALLEACEGRIRLTATQKSFLKKWLIGYQMRGGQAGPLLELLPAEAPNSRRQNTHLFEKLRDALKS